MLHVNEDRLSQPPNGLRITRRRAERSEEQVGFMPLLGGIPLHDKIIGHGFDTKIIETETTPRPPAGQPRLIGQR